MPPSYLRESTFHFKMGHSLTGKLLTCRPHFPQPRYPEQPAPCLGRQTGLRETGWPCLAGAVCPRLLPCGEGKVLASVRMDGVGVSIVWAASPQALV